MAQLLPGRGDIRVFRNSRGLISIQEDGDRKGISVVELFPSDVAFVVEQLLSLAAEIGAGAIVIDEPDGGPPTAGD